MYTHSRTVQVGHDGGVVVGYHDAGAVEPLGLVDQHVAASVVCVIGYDDTRCRRRGGNQEGQEGRGTPSVISLE